MNPAPNRPEEHQRVIALLKEAQAPPADSETPQIPAEVLDRLRGQYGRTPRRALVEQKPSFWAWLSDLFVQPKLALAMALVLVCGVAMLMFRSPNAEPEILRGGQVQPKAAPVYWLQSEHAEPAPSGLGMPKFVVLGAHDPLPSKGDALIFDPLHHEARSVKGGNVIAKISIADPTDNDEWLSAHRQLIKTPVP